MKVLLVEPAYDHPFPHLFTLKAITWWRAQDADVTWTKGMGIELGEDGYDLMQVTTPIFSWAVPDSFRLIRHYAARYPKAEIQVGGVMGTLHASLYEKETGIRPFRGVHRGIIASRPAWEEFPGERVCRVMISAGCSVGCGFCLVTPMYGAQSWKIPGWQDHFAPREIWHVIDDNLSQSLLSIQGLADEVLEFWSRPDRHPFDLNSGVEPRSFTDKVADVMVQLPIHPWRTALDEASETAYTTRAVEMMVARGVPAKSIHVYLLYGWKDDLSDALARLDALLDLGVVPFAMRFVPLDWFGGRQEYRPPHWHPLHYIDFARYVNQAKRKSLASMRRKWPFRWFLENCQSHDHKDDPLLRGEVSVRA
jgi:hypothetical protein